MGDNKSNMWLEAPGGKMTDELPKTETSDKEMSTSDIVELMKDAEVVVFAEGQLHTVPQDIFVAWLAAHLHLCGAITLPGHLADLSTLLTPPDGNFH